MTVEKIGCILANLKRLAFFARYWQNLLHFEHFVTNMTAEKYAKYCLTIVYVISCGFSKLNGGYIMPLSVIKPVMS